MTAPTSPKFQDRALGLTAEGECRWVLFRPFLGFGFAAVVLGGLLAAVTGPLELAMGSWAAAYLVLVVGVAQVVLGAGQAVLVARPEAAPTAWWLWSEALGWNVGSGIVLVGGQVGVPWLVAVGGLPLLAALVLFVARVSPPARGRRTGAVVYRLFGVFLAVSVAVGITLSVVRHQ